MKDSSNLIFAKVSWAKFQSRSKTQIWATDHRFLEKKTKTDLSVQTEQKTMKPQAVVQPMNSDTSPLSSEEPHRAQQVGKSYFFGNDA